MAVERVHLVLDARLMRAFRDMADRNHRSISGQLAALVAQELERQQQTSLPTETGQVYRSNPERASSEKGSHLPSP
jgi:hypothetical protein